MKVDGSLIDLRSVIAPFLKYSTKRWCGRTTSSIALNNAVRSKDKSMTEPPAEHVGLVIGHSPHKEIWPRVVDWLKDRS